MRGGRASGAVRRGKVRPGMESDAERGKRDGKVSLGGKKGKGEPVSAWQCLRMAGDNREESL